MSVNISQFLIHVASGELDCSVASTGIQTKINTPKDAYAQMLLRPNVDTIALIQEKRD